jgi:protein-tyrosine phosphatase
VIDTHCHLLPGIDDGPRDEDAALELARQLARDGVRTIVCTPHCSRRFPTDHDAAGERLEAVRAQLAAADVELRLELAAELSPAYALELPLDELSRRSIAGRFALVELHADTPVLFIRTAARRLAEGGLTAVFAHPERSRAIRRTPAVLAAARDEGSLFQVVAPSLVGRWGEDVRSAAWRLLESGRVDLLASDAHRAHGDGSLLRAARAHVERRLGAAAVRDLTETRPALVVQGVHPREPR